MRDAAINEKTVHAKHKDDPLSTAPPSFTSIYIRFHHHKRFSDHGHISLSCEK